jgi:hypothetical protein
MIEPKTLEEIKLNHQIEMENKEIEYKHDDSKDVIKSCCFELRQSSLTFFGKLIISIGVLSLCSYQLIHLIDCSHQTLYSGILGIVIGAWIK